MPPKGRTEDTVATSQGKEAPLEEREGKRLSEISRKLTLILKSLENLTEVIKEQHQTSTSTFEHLDSTLTKLADSIGTIPEQLLQTTEVSETYADVSPRIKEEAMRVKNKLSKVWDIKLERRDAYWGMIKNKRHLETYNTWINKQNIVIPRYLQKKPYNNEHPAQQKIRVEATLNEFKTEIELQKLRADQHKESYMYEAIDKEMEEIIKQKSHGGTKKCLIQMWKEETERNETFSKRRWNKNERWLNAYEITFSEQYKGISPFFKIEQHQPTYADIIRRKRTPPPPSTVPCGKRSYQRRNNISYNLQNQQPQYEEKQIARRYTRNDRFIKNQQQQQREYNHRGTRRVKQWQETQNNYNNPIRVSDYSDASSDSENSFL